MQPRSRDHDPEKRFHQRYQIETI